jgi:hypothetical protein
MLDENINCTKFDIKDDDNKIFFVGKSKKINQNSKRKCRQDDRVITR